MANQEQLEILKQGVDLWNRWRKENHDIRVDFREADLRDSDLRGANLRKVNLSRANLVKTNLKEADLMGVNLGGANLWRASIRETNFRDAYLKDIILTGADLSETDLTGADLTGADLRSVNFMEALLVGTDLKLASLREANLTGANLGRASLMGADLIDANFSGANLSGANLTNSFLGHTVFGDNDLSVVSCIDKARHILSSTVGTDTIRKSKEAIPIEFLRGCGLSDWEIEVSKLYNPSLSNDERNKILYKIYDLQANQAIQVSPLFISYSHEDGTFVDKIGESLTKKGIRYWRDIHDMKAGRIEKQIDRAIRHNPTVLLVLSEKSIKSDWVEHEVRTARELEKDKGRDVLCPVALEDSWKDSRWPKRLMEQVMEYNILDFSGWEDDSKFDGMFRRLIDGLELFYKG